MVQDKHIKDFENWCAREHIRLMPNSDIFFISERKTLVPRFQIGNKTFVHIVDDIVPEEHAMYQTFARSFNTIIIIPKDVIEDLIKNFTKKDISTHFNIAL